MRPSGCFSWQHLRSWRLQQTQVRFFVFKADVHGVDAEAKLNTCITAAAAAAAAAAQQQMQRNRQPRYARSCCTSYASTPNTTTPPTGPNCNRGCKLNYQPACGSDRVTYMNPCLAECAGASVQYSGPCAAPGAAPPSAAAVSIAAASQHPIAGMFDSGASAGGLKTQRPSSGRSGNGPRTASLADVQLFADEGYALAGVVRVSDAEPLPSKPTESSSGE